jgi:hypothetical protein
MSLETPDKISGLQRKLYGKAKAEPAYRGRRRGPAMKSVGKPDAGNPHVRFDERGRETGRRHTAQATAPFLDSTKSVIPCQAFPRNVLAVLWDFKGLQ